jgi:hypothetical protein
MFYLCMTLLKFIRHFCDILRRIIASIKQAQWVIKDLECIIAKYLASLDGATTRFDEC